MNDQTLHWDASVTSRLTPALLSYLTQLIDAVLRYYHLHDWDGIQVRKAMSELLLPYVRDIMFLEHGKYYIDLWEVAYQWISGLVKVMPIVGIHTVHWLFHPLSYTLMNEIHQNITYHIIKTEPVRSAAVYQRKKLRGEIIIIGDELSPMFINGMLASCCYHADHYAVPLWVTIDRIPLTFHDLIITPHPDVISSEDKDHSCDGNYQIQLAQPITVEDLCGSWIMLQDLSFIQGWLTYKNTSNPILKKCNQELLPEGYGYWKVLVNQDGIWKNANIT